MMTDQQMEAARRALRRKKSEELVKQIKLHQYRQDQQKAAKLHLPFRMIHKREYLSDEVRPNEYYPNDGGIMIDPDTGRWIPVPESERLTDDDIDYWFTRFLTMIDLDGYKDSDLTGEAIPPATAAAIRDEYRRRIADYKDHPDRYNTRAWYPGDLHGRRYPRIELSP